MIFAYLDPGSGSLLLQALLGGLAGIAVAFKAWRARISGKGASAAGSTETDALEEQAVSGES
ncbi:MAG: hypothetical protein R3258_03860 [Acidimicrobiia bacterium]|nr:hypothetical protein [Acidimicrobiia bacterium]